MRLSQNAKFVIAFTLCLISYMCAVGPSKNNQYFRDHTVNIGAQGTGQCSGEQIRAPSGKDYILTASHCKNILVNGKMPITDEAGKTYSLKIIAEDATSDLLLVEGIPHLRGLDIARSVKRGDHVRTFTHGQGLDTYETEGEIISDNEIDAPIGDVGMCVPGFPKYEVIMGPFGFVCGLSVMEIGTTALIVPGSSGGMAVDNAGKLIGVVSASNSGIGYLVKLSDITRFMSHR